jgi:cytochrome c556
MDKLEQLANIVAAALKKARELGEIRLDDRARERRTALMKLLQKHSKNMKKLADAAKHNGLLDQATVNAALDRAIAAAEVIDKELEELLAQAKKG